MLEQPAGFDSTFRHILIAASRAEQLILGARPRVTSIRHVKPTTIALAEISAGKVPWRVVTAEEYELLRLQQLAAKEREEQAPPIFAVPGPVVVPVIEPEAEVEEEEELEEELEGPEFDEDLEVVDDAVAEVLLTEEIPGE
jgi:DNA-directed RNA polymerase omega subunit